jgi:hypothetical protein
MFTIIHQQIPQLIFLNEYVAIPKDFNFDGFIDIDMVILSAKGVDSAQIKNYLMLYQCNDFLTMTPGTKRAAIATFYSLKILEGLGFIVNNTEAKRSFSGAEVKSEVFYKESEETFLSYIERCKMRTTMSKDGYDDMHDEARNNGRPLFVVNITNVLNLLRAKFVENTIKNIVDFEEAIEESKSL